MTKVSYGAIPLPRGTSVDPTDIAIAVKSGVVTLTGFVRSYSQKFEAEAAAKRVAAVSGIANDLEVRLPGDAKRPDPEIARQAVAAIQSQLPLLADRIQVVVKNGSITLEGEVEWNYQRELVAITVLRLTDVLGVSVAGALRLMRLRRSRRKG